MSSSINIGKRIPKTDNNIHGWENVAEISSDVCVVYFGGDGTETDEMANGYAKIIKDEIIAPLNVDIPVYSIKYNFAEIDKNLSRHILFKKHKMNFPINENKNKTEEDNPQYIEELYKKLIEPRIAIFNGLKKREVNDACQRIRRLNIVAHCHGGYTALKLEEMMQNKMLELGYSVNEAEKIQKQMVVVAHAPSCPLGVSKSTFISFISAADGQLPQANNNFAKYIKSKMEFDFKPSFFPDKQGNLFLIKNKFEGGPDGRDCMVDYFEHNDVTYTAKEQTNEGKMMAHFSKNVITNVLINSLQQSDKFISLPDINDLFIVDNSANMEKEKALFKSAINNGKVIWSGMIKDAISQGKLLHNQKKSR